MRGIRKHLGLISTVAVGALLLSACGSDDEPSAGAPAASGGTVTTLRIGISPIADLAPLYLGEKVGIFAKYNLKLNLQQNTSNAPTVGPGLLSNSFQLANTSWATLMNAHINNLPIKAVAPSSAGGATGDTDTVDLLALKDGPSSLKDLAGKTLAVPSLNNLSEIEISSALDTVGLGPDSVKYVVTPYAAMQGALEAHRADAAWVPEPYLTQIKQELGANDLGGMNAAVTPNMPYAVFAAAESYITAHPDVIRNFQLADAEAMKYATDHPDEVRAIIPTFTSISPDVAAKMRLPNWQFPNLQPTEAQKIADNGFKYKIIKAQVDVKELMIPFPTS